MITELEPIDDESINASTQKREESFLAAPFFWKDIELHPLAIGREAAWMSHIARIGLPPSYEVVGSAEAFFGHAYRLLWFCAHEPRVWLAVWMKGGAAAPATLEIMIDQWAEKHIGAGEHADVLKLAFAIIDRAHSNKAKLVSDGDAEGDDSGNEHGPLALGNTSQSSCGPVQVSPKAKRSTNSRKKEAGAMSTSRAARTARSTNGRKKSSGRSRN